MSKPLFGPNLPTFIIAEIGLTHDGSLGNAHSFIDAVADAGASAVKFQHHSGDKVSVWKHRDSGNHIQDATRQEYWKRTGFAPRDYKLLAVHARQRGLKFGLSFFSPQGLEEIDNGMVDFYKIPSGRAMDEKLIEVCLERDKDVLVSTGMCSENELARRVYFGMGRPRYHVLSCASIYPTPPEKIRFEMSGLSSHSGVIWDGLAAATREAFILEYHVCWSKQQYGPDVESSITIEQLAQLVEGVRFIEKCREPVDKDKLAKELEQTRKDFRYGV